ncbi:biotin--[acetyl-CoA-carboxylase] ligase [Desulfosoma caldarium]|uniref:Bifunctional ligase/repressor BirA n=1 Tax=Desulfosoma caldarium TaxID=610254 RepID=A0A3N1VNM5_9BACT|nr:biotin--[acetyl-CoA-carboxylase] ligase [Desulfosoma caldarium]ROR03540.1 BirA family biotin operon repressor/biotin-[acetyl-CoA-carboxylase] ligase [Desulfosoma caldarium]
MTGRSSTCLAILAELKRRCHETVSGNELAAALGISRTAVWKHIRTLQSRGYQIESQRKRGYRLKAWSHSLRPEEVIPLLRTRCFGRTYEYHETIESTNDRAMDLARTGAPHGTVVVAEEQTAGRGRLRRPWVSLRGLGLYLSVILRPELPPRYGHETTLTASLALARSLRDLYGLPARIKWPNDILISGKKVAGILTEMHSDPDRIQFVVVGVGVNVLHSSMDLPSDTLYPATSLALERERLGAQPSGEEPWAWSRPHVLAGFLNTWEELDEIYMAQGLQALREDLIAVSAVIGKVVRVQVSERILEGVARDLTDRGALVLDMEGGRRETVWVGDILHLREVQQDAPEPSSS